MWLRLTDLAVSGSSARRVCRISHASGATTGRFGNARNSTVVDTAMSTSSLSSYCPTNASKRASRRASTE